MVHDKVRYSAHAYGKEGVFAVIKSTIAMAALLSWATPSYAIINCMTVDAVQNYAEDHEWQLLDYVFDKHEHEQMLHHIDTKIVGGVLFKTDRGDRLVVFGKVGSNTCVVHDFIIKSNKGPKPGQGYIPKEYAS